MVGSKTMESIRIEVEVALIINSGLVFNHTYKRCESVKFTLQINIR